MRQPEPGTREKILEVAEALVDRRGMEGLTVKEVARRVGIRPPSLYAHFAGREDLGDAVARRVVLQIASLLEEVLERGGGAEAVLRRGVRAFAAHLYDHPAHVRLLLRDLARLRDGPELDLSSPRFDAMRRHVDALLTEEGGEGSARRIDAEALLSQVEGALLGRLAWQGFDEEGRPRALPPRRRFLDDAEALVGALLAT